MDPRVQQEASRLVKRANDNGQQGRTADPARMAALNEEMNNRIPEWYVELLTSIPLCGLQLDWESDDEEGAEGTIEWSDENGIRSESLECYPGLAILERGYVNVGSDPSGSGDPYFIPADQGDDPPVYQVYHDVSDDADEILSEGLELVAESLSEFFRDAEVGDT